MNRVLARSAGFLAVSLFAVSLHAADAAFLASAVKSIKADDLRKHVSLLASDALEGREAGERGGKAAGTFLVQQLKKFGLQPAGDENSFFQFFDNDYRNVLGILPGSDPQLKNEYIIVCAHYDHVGYGKRTNSYGPLGYIHNGADDNASGTSGLLEMIQALSTIPQRPKRSLLFVFWDAEEKGLLGSEHWLRDPTVSLSKIRMVFNIDMIGRLRNRTVQIFGARTGSGLRRLFAEQNADDDLFLEFNPTLKRDSDHYPFILSHIPAVMLHTGKHEDYHRPSDDVDRLNLKGIEQLTRLMFRAVYTAADAPEVTTFRAEVHSENQTNVLGKASRPRARSTSPIRLGVTWDVEQEKKGVIRIDDVEPNSPAEKAGFKLGDRVLKFGNYEINGKHDFGTVVLASANDANVVVERNGQEQSEPLKVQLQGQPQRVGITWKEDTAEPGTVVLTKIVTNSPADLARLKPGDRIYYVNGHSFQSSEAFLKLVLAADESLKFSVERRGQIQSVELKLLPKVK